MDDKPRMAMCGIADLRRTLWELTMSRTTEGFLKMANILNCPVFEWMGEEVEC